MALSEYLQIKLEFIKLYLFSINSLIFCCLLIEYSGKEFTIEEFNTAINSMFLSSLNI